MQFQVPQFIEIEDKIFGPLTLKQFIFLAGGGGIIVVAYFLLPFIFALPVIVIAASLSLALAFYQVNNKPFIFILQAAATYITNARLYLWKKTPRTIKKKEAYQAPSTQFIPTVRGNNLTNLSFNLTVEEKKGEDSKVDTGNA